MKLISRVCFLEAASIILVLSDVVKRSGEVRSELLHKAACNVACKPLPALNYHIKPFNIFNYVWFRLSWIKHVGPRGFGLSGRLMRGFYLRGLAEPYVWGSYLEMSAGEKKQEGLTKRFDREEANPRTVTHRGKDVAGPI